MSEKEDVQISVSIQGAVDHVRALAPGFEPEVGIVLGSGLGALVNAIEVVQSMPYGTIPGFPESTVEGHDGRLVLGKLSGVSVAVMQGRVHLYEGYDIRQVVFPCRVLIRLGASKLVITNAAGGINPDFDTCDLMLISDHLNLSGTNALLGPNDMGLGPRFPDMTNAYDADFREVAREVAEPLGVTLKEGVYAGLMGPTYETPAEVRMLGVLGADAVGMSTVNEVIAARHMGAKVLGISCISNKAAGLAEEPLSHEEVKAAADAVQNQLTDLIKGVVPKVSSL